MGRRRSLPLASRWCSEARAGRRGSGETLSKPVPLARPDGARPRPGFLARGNAFGLSFPFGLLGRDVRSLAATPKRRGNAHEPGLLRHAGVLAPLPRGACKGSRIYDPRLVAPPLPASQR